MKYVILYNSLSDNKNGLDQAKSVEEKLSDVKEINYKDILMIDDLVSYIKNLSADTTPIICGGDGTINQFVTALDGENIERDILYFPCGSGNDFARDVLNSDQRELIKLNDYIVNLPKVTVNDKNYRYINNVGFGVDGYVCEEADRLRKHTNKSINYSLIAIKGLLFVFKAKTTTVIVDGEKHTFKKAWIASTFNGRYYGGGMKVAPDQDRFNSTHEQTFLCLHNCGKIKAMIVFASIFSQKHLRYTKNVTLLKGNEIEVIYDTPSPIQLDGEAQSNILTYKVKA